MSKSTTGIVRRRGSSAITRKEKGAFLDAFRLAFNVSRAAKSIGRTRQAMYSLRERDDGFRKAWDEIRDEWLDRIEETLFDQGVEGRTPAWGIFALKKWRAERYGDKITVGHEQRANIIVDITPAEAPTNRSEEPSLTLEDG